MAQNSSECDTSAVGNHMLNNCIDEHKWGIIAKRIHFNDIYMTVCVLAECLWLFKDLPEIQRFVLAQAILLFSGSQLAILSCLLYLCTLGKVESSARDSKRL